ncbi:MAG: EamA family transporter [Verrucomicrobia bacterium]|nr:EamA family transporter [Verrucomicrobiota bacterium]
MRRNLGNLSTGGGLGAILLWSATFALARSLSEQVGPLTGGTVVYLIGGTYCLLRLGWSKTPLSHFLNLPRRYLFGCGFLFVLYTAAIYLAVGQARSREQLLEIALVNYLWPTLTSLFTPLLSTLVSCAYLKVSPSPKLWLGCLLLVAGSLVTWRSVADKTASTKG